MKKGFAMQMIDLLFRMIVVCVMFTTLTNMEGVAQSMTELEAANEQEAIRQRLNTYVATFNEHDAAAIAMFWSPNCLSIAEDSGERINGREALQRHFAAFFREAPSARLVGEVTDVQLLRPDVAVIEGRTTLFIDETPPVISVFSATLVREEQQWLISNSRERDVPSIAPPGEALKELEWLLGTWRDQSEGADVLTTFRWSPSRAFMIRSFAERTTDNEREGTQIIGWDPASNQIRTWIFNSDGSFGQGTISKHDQAWMLKLSQTLVDGTTAAGTQVITRIDDDTMTVQVIGESVDGELLANSSPVTVVRAADAIGNTTGPVANEGRILP